MGITGELWIRGVRRSLCERIFAKLLSSSSCVLKSHEEDPVCMTVAALEEEGNLSVSVDPAGGEHAAPYDLPGGFKQSARGDALWACLGNPDTVC